MNEEYSMFDGAGHISTNELKKAISITTSQPGVLGAQGSIDTQKMESMSDMVINIIPTQEQIKFTNALHLEPTGNFLYQYKRTTSTGDIDSIFGVHSEQTAFNTLSDPQFDRGSVTLKIHSDSKSATLAALSETLYPNGAANSYADLLERITKLAINSLLIRENKLYFRGDETIDPLSISGLMKLHQYDVTNKAFYTPAAYEKLEQVIDMRGNRLNVDALNKADRILEDNYDSRPQRELWSVNSVIEGMTPYNTISGMQNFRNLGTTPNTSVANTTINSFVGSFVTSLGHQITPNWDIFIKRTRSYTINDSAKSVLPLAPALPNVSSATAAEVSDANSSGWASVGFVYYAVSAVSSTGGETRLALVSSTPVQITATTGKSIDIKFVSGAGANSENGYRIYRSKIYSAPVADPNVIYYFPIFNVSVAQMAAGYDGSGVAGVIKDCNKWIAGMEDAVMVSREGNALAPDVIHRVEMRSAWLNGITRYRLPIINPTPSAQFYHAYALALPSPTKMIIFKNILPSS